MIKALIIRHRRSAIIKRTLSTKSPRRTHSTAHLDFVHNAPASAPSFLVNTVQKPQMKDLRTLFTASAIPMVGFGFMDNLVMIQAGSYIDSTLGVQFGLATMTAAAAGQVVSDVSGVVFGGSLERLLTRLSLIQPPALTTAQRQLPLCRNVSMAGAVVGVIVGCALGALTLLLVDLEVRERQERTQKLRDIVTDMRTSSLRSDTATIYLLPSAQSKLDLPTQQPTNNNSQPTRVTLMEGSRKPPEHLDDDHVLSVPIHHEGLLAVVEFRRHARPFDAQDRHTATIVGQHLSIFSERLLE